ncbi:hypothetical protein H8356DRAFT_1358226 [Neocallimastix lanati (nom. inval.)]|nr:hypothetical protein H8356DRAFT_1358226 [Neocallimastix sp. JGI-2020a]
MSWVFKKSSQNLEINGRITYIIRYNYHAKVPFIHELLVPFYLSEYHSCNGPYSILRRRLTGRYVHNYVVNYTKDFIKTYDEEVLRPLDQFYISFILVLIVKMIILTLEMADKKWKINILLLLKQALMRIVELVTPYLDCSKPLTVVFNNNLKLNYEI